MLFGAVAWVSDAAFGLGLAGNRRSSMGSTDAFGGRFGALPSVPETGRTGGARDEFKPREATLVLRPDGASFAYAPSTVEIVGDVVSVFNGSMASGQHPVLYFGSLHADSVDASPSKLIARIPLPGGDIDPARYPRRVKLQVKTRGRPEVLWESERHFTLRVAEVSVSALCAAETQRVSPACSSSLHSRRPRRCRATAGTARGWRTRSTTSWTGSS